MASNGIRYRVFKGSGAMIPKNDFYWHCILGNNKIVAPSQSYGTQREAHETIEAIWFDTAVAQGSKLALGLRDNHLRKEAIKFYITAIPIPYTKDSLLRPKALFAEVRESATATASATARPVVKRVALDRPSNYGKSRTKA